MAIVNAYLVIIKLMAYAKLAHQIVILTQHMENVFHIVQVQTKFISKINVNVFKDFIELMEYVCSVQLIHFIIHKHFNAKLNVKIISSL